MGKVAYQRFAAEVLEIYALKRRATHCKMRQALREFGELPGVRTTGDLKPVTVARWLRAHAGRAPTTNESLLRSFKSACAIGVASGYIRGGPFAVRIDVPGFDAGAPGKVRHHPIDDVAAVLGLASAEVRATEGDWYCARTEALAYLFAFAALRKMEGLYLHRDDVDLTRGVLKVDPKRRALKTRASAALVPIAPPLAEVLARWLPEAGSEWVFPNVSRARPWDGGPPGGKALDRLKQLGERAGVKGLTFLSLRHSFGTHARAWGISDLMVKAILRHTTLRTQAYYQHADVPDLLDAASKVSYAPRPARLTG